jgi:hypothetical protein
MSIAKFAKIDGHVPSVETITNSTLTIHDIKQGEDRRKVGGKREKKGRQQYSE